MMEAREYSKDAEGRMDWRKERKEDFSKGRKRRNQGMGKGRKVKAMKEGKE